MKLPVTELLEDCNVEHIALGTPDAAMADRVKARVLNELACRRKPRILRLRRRLRMTLLVAAVLLLFGTVAYAAGLFRVEAQELTPDGESPQTWLLHDQSGDEISLFVGDRFERALAFSFSGDTPPHEVEFRPGWLPEAPTFWLPEPQPNGDPFGTPPWDWAPGEDDWYRYLIDDREQEIIGTWTDGDGQVDSGIPYLIVAEYAYEKQILVLNGAGAEDIVKHEVWEDYEVYEIRCAKDIYFRPDGEAEQHVQSYENYVLLFSRSGGYMINIGGSLPMETLEHIARELEVRDTGRELVYPNPVGDYRPNLINIVRG